MISGSNWSYLSIAILISLRCSLGSISKAAKYVQKCLQKHQSPTFAVDVPSAVGRKTYATQMSLVRRAKHCFNYRAYSLTESNFCERTRWFEYHLG